MKYLFLLLTLMPVFGKADVINSSHSVSSCLNDSNGTMQIEIIKPKKFVDRKDKKLLPKQFLKGPFDFISDLIDLITSPFSKVWGEYLEPGQNTEAPKTH